ncbi:MAG: hypothetical protein AAGA64_08675 [Bacteroidota bacterium]
MKKLTKRIHVVLLLIISPILLFAQGNVLSNARQWIVDNAVAAIFITFLVGAIANLGKVWGGDPDWKAYFKGILIFVIAIGVIATIANGIDQLFSLD